MGEMPEKPGNPTAPLDYAKRPPLHSIGRHRKLLAFMATCVAIVGSVWWNWQPLKHRVLWLYWSHRAASYVMPASVELRVTDPQKARTLLAESRDYVAQPYQPATRPIANFVPETYLRLSEIDPRFNLVTVRDSPRPYLLPITFMGRLVRPDGTPRLVVIQNCSARFEEFGQQIGVLVLPLPVFFDPLPSGNYPYKGIAFTGSGKYVRVDLLSTLLDPTDPSHLIISYCLVSVNRMARDNDEVVARDELDANLQNDDSLIFKPRPGSAWQKYTFIQEIIINGDPAVLSFGAFR